MAASVEVEAVGGLELRVMGERGAKVWDRCEADTDSTDGLVQTCCCGVVEAGCGGPG